MNNFTPNTRFLLFGGTFAVDVVVDGMVRFHAVTDSYDVWQLKEDWLLEKMQTGRLKVLLDSTVLDGNP